MVASARRRCTVARLETITVTPTLSIPCPQVIEMIRLSNGSAL